MNIILKKSAESNASVLSTDSTILFRSFRTHRMNNIVSPKTTEKVSYNQNLERPRYDSTDFFRIIKITLLFIICSMALININVAFAADSIATVIFSKGNVIAIGQDNQTRPLNKNSAIFNGEKLQTNDGYLQLRFSDGGLITLYENTLFEVESYQYSGKQDGTEKAFFKFTKGIFRAISGAIGHTNKKQYGVKANLAVIGIRGTEYLATLDKTLQVSVQSGIVVLSNQAGEFSINAGQSARVLNELTLPQLIRSSGNQQNRQQTKKHSKGKKGNHPQGSHKGNQQNTAGHHGSHGQSNHAPTLQQTGGQPIGAPPPDKGKESIENIILGTVPLQPPPPPPPPPPPLP